MPHAPKGRPAMSKQLLNKLASDREREERQEEEERQEQAERDAREAATAKPPKVYLALRASGKGAHHCSHKDAGTTHKFSKRCIDDGHMGICADCNAAADPFDGCSICGRKGDDLSYENIVVAASQHELNKIKKADEKAARKAAQSEADQPQAKRRKRS